MGRLEDTVPPTQRPGGVAINMRPPQHRDMMVNEPDIEGVAWLCGFLDGSPCLAGASALVHARGTKVDASGKTAQDCRLPPRSRLTRRALGKVGA